MRGKGPLHLLRCRVKGITPAYAGKSSVLGMFVKSCGDHPRVCGEKPAVAVLFSKTMGSPPRMRGKVELVSESGVSLGITPAYAGKRCRLTVCLLRIRDHPRVCGEKTKKIP